MQNSLWIIDFKDSKVGFNFYHLSKNLHMKHLSERKLRKLMEYLVGFAAIDLILKAYRFRVSDQPERHAMYLS